MARWSWRSAVACWETTMRPTTSFRRRFWSWSARPRRFGVATRWARGIVAPAGAILAGLSSLSEAAVPPSLRDATVEAAIKLATGEAIAAGTVSAAASILANEAARAMTIKKLGMMAASLAALGMCVGG